MSGYNSRRGSKNSRVGHRQTRYKDGNQYIRFKGMSICVPGPRVMAKKFNMKKQPWYKRALQFLRSLM